MTGRAAAVCASGAEKASANCSELRSRRARLIPGVIDGVLPDGVHACTLEEVVERFGRSQGSDRRQKLTDALKQYIEDVRSLGVAAALIIDGSYVTIKAKPNDIDLILVLRENLHSEHELVPAEYNVKSTRMVRRKYAFD